MVSNVFKNLSGKILVASPYMLYGNIFHKSLIYMLSHGENGSIGLIINFPVNKTPFRSLLKTMISNVKEIKECDLPIHLGGPVEPEKAFFIHSDDYDQNTLFKFQDNLAVSSNNKILEDIAGGSGPKDTLFMVGYTAWEAGQLESELENNLWIVSDYHRDLLFNETSEYKWQTALQRLGIDDAQFVSKMGHC